MLKCLLFNIIGVILGSCSESTCHIRPVPVSCRCRQWRSSLWRTARQVADGAAALSRHSQPKHVRFVVMVFVSADSQQSPSWMHVEKPTFPNPNKTITHLLFGWHSNVTPHKRTTIQVHHTTMLRPQPHKQKSSQPPQPPHLLSEKMLSWNEWRLYWMQ